MTTQAGSESTTTQVDLGTTLSCVACMDAPVTHGFVCAAGVHACVCEECGVGLKRCPYCQHPVTSFLRVFDVSGEGLSPPPPPPLTYEQKRAKMLEEKRERIQRTWARGMTQTNILRGIMTTVVGDKDMHFMVPIPDADSDPADQNAIWAFLNHNKDNTMFLGGRYTTAKRVEVAMGGTRYIKIDSNDFESLKEALIGVLPPS